MNVTGATKDLFRFKEFSMFHGSSSMKIGVDGVLIGAWGDVNGRRGIDIGCGCGVVGIMAAQRNKQCQLEMIDIHEASVKEALLNIEMSSWKDRVKAFCADAWEFSFQEENRDQYDFIISNPPFFQAGVKKPMTAREKSRHGSALSPHSLLDIASRILKPGGKLSMITSCDYSYLLSLKPEKLVIERICRVSDRAEKNCKRLMLTYRKGADEKTGNPEEEILYIRNSEGAYSDEYRKLTGDFYLAF